MRKLLATLTISAATASLGGAVLIAAPTAQAYPPTPPDVAQTKTLLAGLEVRAEGSRDGYSRDKFPHWIEQGDNCNTREVVLKRDGTNVTTDSECRATSGSWYSVYDNEWLDSASDIQIDHIVPLAEAWDSGANAWTTDERRTFANDLVHSQLIAVSGSSNQSKSDQDPADWWPPNTSERCFYARDWVWVKSTYDLTVDSAEKAALEQQLDSC